MDILSLWTDSPHENAWPGLDPKVLPEMSLRVSTIVPSCRVVRVCAGQDVAGFEWRSGYSRAAPIRYIPGSV